jgi:hypothetical protein
MLQLMILGYKLTYFVKHETKGKQCNTEYEVINMSVLLIDKTFFSSLGRISNKSSTPILEQTVLLSLSIFPYTLMMLRWLTKYKACNLTIRYIDDVLSINNTNCANYIPLMYPIEFGKPERRETASSAAFIDLWPQI